MTSRSANVRKAVVTAVMAAVALLHILRVGSYLDGTWFRLYYSFFSDVAVPFAMYFLLCLPDMRPHLLHDWRVRALVVFGTASAAEIAQGFGIPVLGRTFDPLDIAMYGAGVLLAVGADRVLLVRFLPGWDPPTSAGFARV